ncbi:MAG TPA: CrcB family protein [Anaeromyxobacteraceae bacterium]
MGPFSRFVLVCLGGAAGTGARYLLATGALRWLGPAFPWGTLGVNLLGSLLLGAVMELAVLGYLTPDLRVVLASGVMGGFTTYSSFNQETLGYLGRGAWWFGGSYLAGTVVGCLAAGALGVAAARWLTAGG